MPTSKPSQASLINIVKKRGGNGLHRLADSADGLLAHTHTRFQAGNRKYVVGTDFDDVERGRPKGGRRTHRDPTLKVYWRDDTL